MSCRILSRTAICTLVASDTTGPSLLAPCAASDCDSSDGIAKCSNPVNLSAHDVTGHQEPGWSPAEPHATSSCGKKAARPKLDALRCHHDGLT
jgi:hypothetical protein